MAILCCSQIDVQIEAIPLTCHIGRRCGGSLSGAAFCGTRSPEDFGIGPDFLGQAAADNHSALQSD